MWSVDWFRTQHVTADLQAAKGTKEATPLKSSEVALGAATKIIQGDWPWHANRGNIDKRSIWHNYKGKSRFNMLLGDGHVEFFLFPNEMANWTLSPAPDPNFKWW